MTTPTPQSDRECLAAGLTAAVKALAASPPAPQPAADVSRCRDDGRCQYAIDRGAEAEGYCSPTCLMPRPQPAADVQPLTDGTENIWDCKIGGKIAALPPGADAPMRRAVEECFVKLTGAEPEFLFSGWGGKLTEPERAVVEKRQPVFAAPASLPAAAQVPPMLSADEAWAVLEQIAAAPQPSPASVPPQAGTDQGHTVVPAVQPLPLGATGTEDASPLAPMKGGDYVLVTKYSDGDPRDPWAIGFYAGRLGGRHFVRDGAGVSFRVSGFPHVGRISREIGDWLCKHCELLEHAPGKINLWRMYDWNYVNARIADEQQPPEHPGTGEGEQP